MTTSKLTVALALTGAVALASGAYALGSQAGDGDAVAAKTPNANPYGGPPPGRPGFGRFHRGGPGADLSGLATKLGVSEDKLRQALEDLRPNGRPGDEIAQALADALGIDVAKVTAAFEKLRPARDEHRRGDHGPGDFAAALAKQLGLSTAKVEKALAAQRDHRGDPAALAKALGVTPAQLRQAFAKTFRAHRADHRGPDTAALAKELGVTQAQLKAAFDKVKAAKEKEFADKRAAFAKQLAAKLGIDASKVENALEAPMGFRGFRARP